MGNRITDALKGLAFLDPEWESTGLVAADSTYTEADPRPGSSSTTDLQARTAPQVVGAQAKNVTIIGTKAGGFPGIGKDGAGVAYYFPDESEVEADARHHRPAHQITDARNFGVTTNDVVALVAYDLSGHVLLANEVDDSVVSALYLWDPATNEWTNPGSAPAIGGCMVQIPGSSRVLWIDEDEGVAYVTEDFGATWSVWSKFPPFSDLSGATYGYTARRRVAAFDPQGQLMWVGSRGSGTPRFDIFVSSDMGHTWTRPNTVSATEDRPIVCAHPDGYMCLLTQEQGSNGELWFRRLPSASTDIDAIDSVLVEDPTSLDIDQSAMCVDEDGVIWVYFLVRATATYQYIEWRCSYDGGDTWVSDDSGFSGPDGSSSVIVSYEGLDNSATTLWNNMVAVPSMGSVWLLAGCDRANAGAIILRLGGWQGPYHERDTPDSGYPARDPRWRTQFAGGGVSSQPKSVQMLPLQPKSGLGGGNFTLAGTGSESLDDGGILFEPDNGQVREYSGTLNPTSHAEDMFFRFALKTTTTAARRVGFEIVADTHSFSILFDHDSFEVVDDDDGVRIGDVVTFTDGARVDMEVSYDDSTGIVSILYIDKGATPTGTKWTTVSRTLSGSHASTGTTVFTFGQVVAASAAGEQSWWYYLTGHLTPSANTQIPGVLTGRDGWGKPVDGTHPYPIPDLYDTANDRVSRLLLHGGPLVRTETYTHDVAPDRPIENLFPASDSSPAAKWRSADKTLPVDIAVDLQTYDSLVAGSFSWLVLVKDANFRKLQVDAKTASGSYATLGTVDLAEGFDACSFARVGDIIRPDSPYTGTAGARYIAPGELRGGHVIIDPTGTPVVRRIKTNTGGLWSGDDMSASIVIEGVTGAEATSGTIAIVWPSGVMAIHRSGASAAVSRFRFRIPTGEVAAEDYFEAGVVAPFGLHPTGKQWADGWEWTHSPNTRIDADSRRSERRAQLGPNQASVVLSWDDGARMSAHRAQSSPDYVADSSEDHPLAARDEVWRALVEWLDLSAGASRPVLFCGKVPADGVTITDPTLYLYGYLRPQNIRARQATGDEGVNEFLRASGIQVVEAV